MLWRDIRLLNSTYKKVDFFKRSRFYASEGQRAARGKGRIRGPPMKFSLFKAVLTAAVATLVCCGCGGRSAVEDTVNLGGLLDESVPLTDAPAKGYFSVSSPGTASEKNRDAAIDYSNTADGYVTAAWTGQADSRLKVLVNCPGGVTYQYNLRTDGEYEAFPLSDGDGTYTVGVYRNISGSEYAAILSASFPVTLTDEFAPFLRPNQYVNYRPDSAAAVRASELCAGMEDNLKKVEAVYAFVVSNTVYDGEKAKTVTAGYLPDVDDTLRTGKGICFDYAALMAAMLRTQGVPVKLVVGYTGEVYHAWLNVWSETSGWIEGGIFFDGKEWMLMDPTFASGGNSSRSVMNYISDESNYTAKFLY